MPALTRAALRREVATLTAQRDTALHRAARAEAQVEELLEQDVRAQLVRVTHHFECSEAENARLTGELDQVHVLLATFTRQHPHLFPRSEVDR